MIFTLCRMITWVVFLRMFWNLINSLPVMRGGSLSFLTFQSYWTWYDGKYDFYPMSYDNLSSVSQNVLKLYHQLTSEETRIPFIFAVPELLDLIWRKIGFLPRPCRMITWVDGPYNVIGYGGRVDVHTGFRTITLVLYIGSLPNLATLFCGSGRTLFILGSLGQRSPLL